MGIRDDDDRTHTHDFTRTTAENRETIHYYNIMPLNGERKTSLENHIYYIKI